MPGISLCHSPHSCTVPLSGPLFRELFAGILAAGKSVRFTALGHSMTPSIRHGDVVTISPIGTHRIRRGDVVAVVCDPAIGQVLVHRVVRLSAHTLETRGDALGYTDGRFPSTAVIGRVTAVERHGRPVTWYGHSRACIVPLQRRLLGIWSSVRRFYGERRGDI